MKLGAVALDYDGTIATDGVLELAVREAIGELRQRGVAVLLVTGRRMADLRKVAGDLSCFDAVVAENGTVLEFPRNGRHVALAHLPAHGFFRALDRRGVPWVAGESVVEMDGRWAAIALEVIRELEQPLILAFNRGRLMILPQAVGKSTGLKHALFALRLSVHNTVGVGDAENDHDLLDACEVGVAVRWGSRALVVMADEVIEGLGPKAVGDYLRRIGRQRRLSASQMGRRRILLGHDMNGDAVKLAIRGRTIVIAGEPATGKSYLAGLICEQLILQRYCLCILDPEGDYRPLEALPGVLTLGGSHPLPNARELARALRHPDSSVIVDMSQASHREKREYLRAMLPTLAALRRSTGLPHKILLDEAHYFLENHPETLADPELAGYVLVTYRASSLAQTLGGICDSVILVTRESDPEEVAGLLTMCNYSGEPGVVPAALRELPTNEAALLPGSEEAMGRVRIFQLVDRLTEHVRHRAKYMDVPVEDRYAFVFTSQGRVGARVRTLKDFMRHLQLEPAVDIEAHMQRHDFSRWIEDVFRDRPLSARIFALEERMMRGDVVNGAESMARAIRARYDVPHEFDVHEAQNLTPAPTRT